MAWTACSWWMWEEQPYIRHINRYHWISLRLPVWNVHRRSGSWGKVFNKGLTKSQRTNSWGTHFKCLRFLLKTLKLNEIQLHRSLVIRIQFIFHSVVWNVLQVIRQGTGKPVEMTMCTMCIRRDCTPVTDLIKILDLSCWDICSLINRGL